MHPRVRELLDYLDSQRAVLREAYESVAPDLRDRPPAPDRWSAAGIVEHLAIIEQRLAGMFAARIAAARAEGLGQDTSSDPILPTINLTAVLDRSTRVESPRTGVPSGLPADAAWDALERAGAAVRDALLSGDGLALGEITHPHPLLGPLTLYDWFGFIGAHEARHAAQIRETIPQTVTR